MSKKKKKKAEKPTLPKELMDHIKANVKNSKDLSDTFREMYKVAVQEMLQGELDDHLDYKKNQTRPANQKNSRNGKSKKLVKTELGEIDLEVPRDRDSSFDPQLVKKRQKVIDKIESNVISMYSVGLSTKDISNQIEEIYGVSVSKQAISRITDRLLPKLTEWQNRPLEPIYLLVWLDAIHIKVRVDGKVKTKAFYLVIGLDQEGKKDVLGIWLAETESASFWLNVLTDLQARGVEDLLIASIDNLNGFAEAIESMFPKCHVQTCVIHQIRNSLKYVAWKNRKEFARDLKTIYSAANLEAAQAALEEVSQKWGDVYPVVIKSWRTNWERLTAFFDYPPAIRKIMYTTNIIENVNRGIRKITKTKSAFPSDDAARKVVYLAVLNITKKWTKPIHNWQVILSQFAMLFPERLKLDL